VRVRLGPLWLLVCYTVGLWERSLFQLPPATTNGLHRLCDQARAYDYASSLRTVNELVSTGSFAVLSEFLPGVKVLVQVASQLGVYL